MIHLFHDSTLNTWRLITDKLPEKPESCSPSYDFSCEDRSEFRGVRHVCKCCAAEIDYTAAIAALKQNALTVGNQELANSVFIGKPVPDELYEWIGGYKETQETDGVGDNVWTVAILTLPEKHILTKENISATRLKPVPEEKKNTMENNYERELEIYLNEGINYGANTIKNADPEDLKQLASDSFHRGWTSSGSVAAPKEEESYPQPGKRCMKEGELMIPCHVIEGSDALDYAGKCFGCGSKRAITFDEENQTEADAAREYLIKEGLDPDELVKEGLAVINGIHEKIRLEKELAAAKESIKALYRISQQKLYETEVNTVEFDNIKSVLDHAQKVLG